MQIVWDYLTLKAEIISHYLYAFNTYAVALINSLKSNVTCLTMFGQDSFVAKNSCKVVDFSMMLLNVFYLFYLFFLWWSLESMCVYTFIMFICNLTGDMYIGVIFLIHADCMDVPQMNLLTHRSQCNHGPLTTHQPYVQFSAHDSLTNYSKTYRPRAVIASV